LKVNHQLESRMPEIGLFGSGGGASPKRRPYLINLGVRRYAHMPTPRPLWLRLRRCLIYTGQACLVHITYVFASKVNRQLLVNGNKSGCDPVPIYTESLNENT
jgi:hypothetical protein